MIVRIKQKTGTERWYTVNHVIFHEEKGKDGWLEILGGAPSGRDNSYLFDSLTSVSLWEHGRVIRHHECP